MGDIIMPVEGKLDPIVLYGGGVGQYVSLSPAWIVAAEGGRHLHIDQRILDGLCIIGKLAGKS